MQITRESIFVTAIKSFLKGFLWFLGALIAIFIMFTIAGSLSGKSASMKSNITFLNNHKGDDTIFSPTAPVVLKINIKGVIGSDGLQSKTILAQLEESRKYIFKNDRVKALLVNINSPGGTVNDSDNIYTALQEYKEKYKTPIYVYVDGLCASGGMYIASASDKIYCSPTSIVGSVGVIMGPFFNFSDLMVKWGVKSLTLTDGKGKDSLNPFRPWNENEETAYKNIGQYFYDRFVQIVTTGRPNLSKDKLINDYGAKIFDPVTAENYGYVDHANASLNETLLALLKAANINPDDGYQFVQMEPKMRFVQSLFNEKSPLSQFFSLFNKKEDQTIQNPFYYLYQP